MNGETADDVTTSRIRINSLSLYERTSIVITPSSPMLKRSILSFLALNVVLVPTYRQLFHGMDHETSLTSYSSIYPFTFHAAVIVDCSLNPPPVVLDSLTLNLLPPADVVDALHLLRLEGAVVARCLLLPAAVAEVLHQPPPVDGEEALQALPLVGDEEVLQVLLVVVGEGVLAHNGCYSFHLFFGWNR